MLRDIHSPRGIDPRCDAESDVIASHVRTTVRYFHQSLQAVVARVRQISQPECDDCAILTRELHDIRDSTDRGDLQECRDEMVLFLLTQHCVCELERNADAGKMFVGIRTLWLVWIYDSVGVGITALGIRDMMIRDDE